MALIDALSCAFIVIVDVAVSEVDLLAANIQRVDLAGKGAQDAGDRLPDCGAGLLLLPPIENQFLALEGL